jgi:DNA-binding NarL/FixJ family response regulator
MDKIRILLADDHTILREGLRAFLSYYRDVEIVGEAGDGIDAVDMTEALQPDIVLMDIAMPRLNGLEATRLIRERFPRTRVLILTQYEDSPYVLPLLKAGASGYVLKRALGADLVDALRAVARGESFLYPPVARTVLEEIRQTEGPDTATGDPLTPREREVLRGVACGETSRQIAARLSLSVKTVEWHRSNMMAKLQLRSVAELVRYAIEHGLVD